MCNHDFNLHHFKSQWSLKVVILAVLSSCVLSASPSLTLCGAKLLLMMGLYTIYRCVIYPCVYQACINEPPALSGCTVMHSKVSFYLGLPLPKYTSESTQSSPWFTSLPL